MSNPDNDSRLAYVEGWVSIAVNVLLFALKYWAGIVSGSVALLADAWHTLSDSISSIVVMPGVRVSSKDRDHPFGHRRAMLISAEAVEKVYEVYGVPGQCMGNPIFMFSAQFENALKAFI